MLAFACLIFFPQREEVAFLGVPDGDKCSYLSRKPLKLAPMRFRGNDEIMGLRLTEQQGRM